MQFTVEETPGGTGVRLRESITVARRSTQTVTVVVTRDTPGEYEFTVSAAESLGEYEAAPKTGSFTIERATDSATPAEFTVIQGVPAYFNARTPGPGEDPNFESWSKAVLTRLPSDSGDWAKAAWSFSQAAYAPHAVRDFYDQVLPSPYYPNVGTRRYVCGWERVGPWRVDSGKPPSYYVSEWARSGGTDRLLVYLELWGAGGCRIVVGELITQ